MSCKKRFLFAVLVGFEIRICKGYLATSPPRRVSADFDARERNVASKLSVAQDRTWTIKNLAQWGGIGDVGLVFVGSATTIADILQEWVEETDVDGFNLAYAVTHKTFEDIVNLLAPELQRRGVYPSAYGPGSTLREKLFSAGPYLPANHPAAEYRDIEAFKRKQAERGVAAEKEVGVVQEVTA